MEYVPVIGLEIHVQLSTASKIFCPCSTRFGTPPNTQVCPVCMGQPGTLPVLNRRVVDYALAASLACHCKLNMTSVFARKNYFYPDLPKGYQISQFDLPLAFDGWIRVRGDGVDKVVGITRIHIEEDAGKSFHPETEGATLSYVDFNRCGVPLIEIVSKPDLYSPEEAYAYLDSLKRIIEYLEISDCNMEEGSLRCDANVSLRPKHVAELGTRTEVKNMNSFHGVQKALYYEIERQREVLTSGGRVIQETLLWDEKAGVTKSMRSKEESHDYRYFPEPDLPPLIVTEAWVCGVRESLPELPVERRERFMRQFGLGDYESMVLTQSRYIADYYEAAVAAHPEPKAVANLVLGEVLRELKERRLDIRDFPIPPEWLGDLLERVRSGEISLNLSKEVFAKMVADKRPAGEVIAAHGLRQVSDTDQLAALMEEILAENPTELAAYLGGKETLFGFFMGQVMRKTGGKANPKLARELMVAALERRKG